MQRLKCLCTLSVVNCHSETKVKRKLQALTFTTGDGIEDSAMAFRGTLTAINFALSRLEYTGNSNSNSEYAEESLTLWICDLGVGGESNGHSLNETIIIPIHVSAVNDAPRSRCSSYSNRLFSVGYQVSDTDLAITDDICVNISVSSKQGHVSLATTNGIIMAESYSGMYERFMSFRGPVAAVNLAMEALEYVRSPAFDGVMSLLFH